MSLPAGWTPETPHGHRRSGRFVVERRLRAQQARANQEDGDRALVAGVLVAVALAVAAGLSVIVAHVLGIGLITFLSYGYDKLQAIRGGRRVPEPALRLVSLVGGALGGWAGMLIWRHKTNDVSFWIAQVARTIAIAAALWLL